MSKRSQARYSELESIVHAHAQRLVQAIAEIVRTGLAPVHGEAKLGRPATDRARPRLRHIEQCIAPGCGNPSKGPRFHYLCLEHKHASRREYEAWREAARTRRESGGKRPAIATRRPAAGKLKAARKSAAAHRPNIRPCIAPGCANPSKGPRFHYLCDQHKHASRRAREAWRAAHKGA